jgi:hypothetical protein
VEGTEANSLGSYHTSAPGWLSGSGCVIAHGFHGARKTSPEAGVPALTLASVGACSSDLAKGVQKSEAQPQEGLASLYTVAETSPAQTSGATIAVHVRAGVPCPPPCPPSFYSGQPCSGE